MDHYQLRRVIDLYVGLAGEDLGKVANRIDTIVAGTELPLGVRVNLRGMVQGMRASMRSFALGLGLARIEMEELAPVAEAMERGGRLAAKAEVTDSLLDRCKPIAGTPEDCIAAIEEYREAGCTHVMLELWGDRRHDQIRLFGEKVLPYFRS